MFGFFTSSPKKWQGNLQSWSSSGGLVGLLNCFRCGAAGIPEHLRISAREGDKALKGTAREAVVYAGVSHGYVLINVAPLAVPASPMAHAVPLVTSRVFLKWRGLHSKSIFLRRLQPKIVSQSHRQTICAIVLITDARTPRPLSWREGFQHMSLSSLLEKRHSICVLVPSSGEETSHVPGERTFDMRARPRHG